jgi:hypothetical protein
MLNWLEAIAYNYLVPVCFAIIGVIVFRFFSLLTWDLLRALLRSPLPEGQEAPVPNHKKEMAGRWKFLCCFFTAGMAAEAVSGWLAVNLTMSAHILWLLMVLGFSAPLFLVLVLVTLIALVCDFSKKSEMIYDRTKGWALRPSPPKKNRSS